VGIRILLHLNNHVTALRMTGRHNSGNVNPNPDAIEEFRVITNGYGAEYGKFSGGVINAFKSSF
jgi:hypothetical protein